MPPFHHQILERAGVALALEPKAFNVLALIVEKPGRVFTKQEIFDAVWPDTAVSDHALTRVIAQLRRVLGDESRTAATPTPGFSTSSAGQCGGVTNERGQTWVRSWSPDGRKIAAAAFGGGLWDLRWIDAASGREGTISPAVGPHVYMRYPEWSARGDLVVFERGELRGNIWTIALN